MKPLSLIWRSLADGNGRLWSSTDATGGSDTTGRCLRRAAQACTVEAGAEQTLPKVPG
jgi:hypothetical protein